MAKVPTFSLSILLFLATSLPTSSQEFSRKLSMPERLTQLHFFSYENFRGDAPSALVVAQAPTTNTYQTRFGEVVALDARLMAGPNLSSGVVARVQGMYASTDVSNLLASLSVFNLVFIAGEFNGSTLHVFGRYQFAPLSTVRELRILGGTGDFQFAEGYVLIRTYFEDVETGIYMDEYHVNVLH